MIPADLRRRFPQFYDNPAVLALAGASRWTVSGRLGDSADATAKVPIDVRHMLDGCTPACRHSGPLRGAFALDATCLMDLDELTRALPNAANHAFYLQAHIDGLVVVDVEPGCPRDIAEELLHLPGLVYSELSMSGQGFHVVAPVPTNMHDFAAAAEKRALREEHGWFEILLDHWVTFTRSPVPVAAAARPAAALRQPRQASVETLFARLAATARVSALASAAAVDTDDAAAEIPHAAQIVEQTVSSARGRLRDLRDFEHDTSRWEFSVLATLYHRMQTPLGAYRAFGASYSPGDLAWLLYRAAQEILPPRPKHDQARNGRPFLLDRAATIVADRSTAGSPASRDARFSCDS